MAMTDIIVLSCSLLLIARGASRGFLRSLLGPVALLIATVASIIYYQVTKNALISLLIGLIGPIVVQMAFNLVLRSFGGLAKSEAKLTPPSRMVGAALTLIWGWIFIILLLLTKSLNLRQFLTLE